MGIKLQEITQTYGDSIAVNRVSLEIEDGEMIALLGPSGCGKTTLLKTIAGLLPLNEGRILLNEEDISTLAPQKRNIAMVFQNYALFPHMTVEENIAYGLKLKKMKKSLRNRKVNEILAAVKLENYHYRQVSELSGGQQQRVALARALVMEPSILLFDEPLSNLDQRLRISMRQEIKKIQKEYGITSIYVTHDQEEAMSISDRIAVMKDGIIQQVGSPGEIYSQPNNCFVADFMGIANIVEIPDMVLEQKHYEIPFLGSSVQIDLSDKALTSNSGLNIVFRPEEVQIDDNGKFEGTVTWFENLGSLQRITMIVQGRTIIAQQLHDHQNPRIYSPEEKIRFHIKLSARNMIKN